MTTLLHISSSPRAEDSESFAIARTFTDAYSAAHPEVGIDHWDLWDDSLPGFATGARAKMTVFAGGSPTGEQGEASAAARRAFDRFAAADRLLFGVPMWNGPVPFVLKQFIDGVSQPGWVFGVDAHTGYEHLLLAGRGTRVAVVYTSAVWGLPLGREFGSDFQSTYFSDWLRWTGLDAEIRLHLTLTGDRDAERALAHARPRDVAKGF